MSDEIFPRSHSLWAAFEAWYSAAGYAIHWRDAWQTFLAGADAGLRQHLDTRPAGVASATPPVG